MATLSLELFTRPFDDMERRQYEICSAIGECTARFRRNRLYPELQELIALYRALERIVQEHEHFHAHQSPHILPPAESVGDEAVPSVQPLEQMFDLIRWAMPLIAAAIEEGAALFDFVEDNITIASVGLVPMYTGEGYVLVPEHRTCTLHVLRYATSQLVEHGNSYRMLRTIEVLSLSHRGVWSAPETIKHRLIEQYPDLPNPATFSCETDLDFPYTETILPVVKRKLMQMLS